MIFERVALNLPHTRSHHIAVTTEKSFFVDRHLFSPFLNSGNHLQFSSICRCHSTLRFSIAGC